MPLCLVRLVMCVALAQDICKYYVEQTFRNAYISVCGLRDQVRLHWRAGPLRAKSRSRFFICRICGPADVYCLISLHSNIGHSRRFQFLFLGVPGGLACGLTRLAIHHARCECGQHWQVLELFSLLLDVPVRLLVISNRPHSFVRTQHHQPAVQVCAHHAARPALHDCCAAQQGQGQGWILGLLPQRRV